MRDVSADCDHLEAHSLVRQVAPFGARPSFTRSQMPSRHFNTVLLATFDDRDYIITG